MSVSVDRTQPPTEIEASSVSFETVIAESDFVVATLNLTKETEGLFNSEVFGKMKNDAIFVNISRGGIVNQKDLYDALKNGQIRGAGIDVTNPEPMATDDPLLTLPNCIVLPHIGSAEVATRRAMAQLCAENILAALKNEKMSAQVN